MTTGLSARQTQILKALIDEYIETAIAVGSEIIEKKYNLGVSSATIRNEMAELTKIGFLRQPHTSAGRVPTSTAMKFYIDQLMEERKMSLADEVKAKEDVWDVRNNVERLMQEATDALADQTNNLAVSALVDDGGERVWHSGLSNIFSNPEFNDLELCEELMVFLEASQKIHGLFFGRGGSFSPVEVFFGEEMGWRRYSPVSIVATHFTVKGKPAAMAVVGPARISPSVIPTLRYFGSLMQEVAGS